QPLVNRGGAGSCALEPMGAPRLHPIREEVDLRISEEVRAGEVPVAGLGQPRGHVMARHNLDDLPAALPYVVKGEQRKRRGLARAVAACAMLVDDGRDIVSEGGFRAKETAGKRTTSQAAF